MSTETLVIPGQVTFYFLPLGRGKQAGVTATCAVEGSGEIWMFAAGALMSKPTVGATFKPHGDIGTDQRTRDVTKVESDGARGWKLTCTVQA
jgi:hypothetical protein